MSELPPSSPTCPRCSAPLAPTSAQGALCPRCLLAQGLADSESNVEDASATGERPPRTPPPGIDELSALFPELEIVELLGQGGMGAVYKARQRALDRWVALKLLTPRAGDEQAFAARFEREARTLARLAHENIVGIHASGRVDGRAYLLMEYVDGLNLRQLIRQGGLDVPKALALVRQVCDALEYAHAQGVVHRDIKPENVLIDKRGRVKIADFGLAKIVGEERTGEPITRTQQSMGTPQYMAPEQLTRSRDVDHRADIYSLGVVFYELLTGELPLGRFEPPSRHVHVDVRLDELVLRALEREPERRYQHASEIKTGIEKLDQPVPAAPRASAPSLGWVILAWPAALILGSAERALGLPDEVESASEWCFVGAVVLLLALLALGFRRDRRGAILGYVLGACVLAAALLGIASAGEFLPWLHAELDLAPRSADIWILRLLIGVVGFEALRSAWSSRSALLPLAARRGQQLVVDGLVLLNAALVALLSPLGSTLFWTRGKTAYLAVLPCLAVCLLEVCFAAETSGPPSRKREPAPPEPERPWLRRVALPAIVALSAWVMARYTFTWGWFGALASSSVLALAVVGYLQQTIPEALRAELRLDPPALRVTRAVLTFVLLAVGALALGSVLVQRCSRSTADARTTRVEPREIDALGSADLRHLAELVALPARASLDPLKGFASRVQGASYTPSGGRNLPEGAFARPEPRSDGAEAVLLIAIANVLLLWTKRWGWTWRGCWRYACEATLVVLLGLGASLLVVWIQVQRSPPSALRPLVVEADVPRGIDALDERLEAALALAGYALHTRIPGEVRGPSGAVMRICTLGADIDSPFERLRVWPGPPARTRPQLLIRLAGDPGQRASALCIDAGLVSDERRGEWETELVLLWQRMR